MLSFVWKLQSFYPKDVCLFSAFCLNEEELNQQVCLIKHVEHEISDSTSHKRKRKRGAKTSNFKNTIFKTPKKLSVVILVTNYHKLSLLPLVVRPWQKL